MLKIFLSLFIFSVIASADAPMGMWSDTTHNIVSLGWTDSDDETAYKIYAVGSTDILLDTLAQDTVSYTVNDINGVLLTPITLYQFKITAIIGGVEVEHPLLQITEATTTHEWVNGPFKTCINSYIGIGATATPTKNQLEALDASRMILCENKLIDDISPVGDLKNIMSLSLKKNLLTMTAIAPLASLMQLGELILAENNLNGAIPSWISTMTNMSSLDLSNNNLSSSIPSWITDLPLNSLKLFDNNLTGSIPTDIGKWASLHSLYLDNNKLSGVIPVQLGTLTALQYVDLKNNNLTGIIPSGITNNPNLFSLDLSNNKLSGVIPPNLDDITNLVSINLSHNELTGVIPSIGVNSFPNNGINFSYNKLTGSIPSSLGQIFNLRSLHLANNQLKGEIPSTIENLTNINAGDLSMDYNCDLFTDNTSLKTYLNSKLVTGYTGILNTNGNCGISFSPSTIIYLLD